MNTGSPIIALAMFLAAIAVALIVAERLGKFDPPQDPEAFQARLEIAREYLAPIHARYMGPNSNLFLKAVPKHISGLEESFPRFVDENRAEVEAIHAKWISDSSKFYAEAMAHFFALHFSASDLRAKRDKTRRLDFGMLRRLVIMEMNKSGLDLIRANSGLHTMCLLSDDVIPALMELGMPELKGTDEIQSEDKSKCRRYEAQGWFDPARQFPEQTDTGQDAGELTQ